MCPTRASAIPFIAFSKNRRHHVSYAMPRPATHKSPIRDLRKIIGKSQREFGLSIGVSPSAMKRIENNDLSLSRRVAYKIELEAGIDREALLRGTLRAKDGQQYTAPFYEFWKEVTWQDENVAAFFASRLEPLLVAAAVGSKKRMWLVIGEILETLDRCRTRFNLQRPIDAILAKHRPTPMKWDDLMKPLLELERKEATATRKLPPSGRRKRKA
jgi:transcriptional regulator with XRE-family HTH domain